MPTKPFLQAVMSTMQFVLHNILADVMQTGELGKYL